MDLPERLASEISNESLRDSRYCFLNIYFSCKKNKYSKSNIWSHVNFHWKFLMQVFQVNPTCCTSGFKKDLSLNSFIFKKKIMSRIIKKFYFIIRLFLHTFLLENFYRNTSLRFCQKRRIK